MIFYKLKALYYLWPYLGKQDVGVLAPKPWPDTIKMWWTLFIPPYKGRKE